MRLLRNNYSAELIAIGSRPNRGKTHYLCEYIKESLKDEKIVLLIEFDASKEEILFRTKGVDSSKLVYYNSTINDCNVIGELIKEHNPDIVYVDYLNLLPNNELSINDLRDISNDMNIPIIVSFQLSNSFDNLNIEEMKDEEILPLINNAISTAVDELRIVDMKINRSINHCK